MSHDDFDFEPVPGLPAHLPAGEQMLWQGSPVWGTVARRVFYVDKIAMYFTALLAWRFGVTLYEGLGLSEAVLSALRMAPLGLMAIGLFLWMARSVGRTTIYTITNRRVVMRFGMALPLTINLPFRQIGAAGLSVYGDGSGDIPLETTGKGGFGYLVLWPHARGFHFSKPQPMLRCVPDAVRVAEILGAALASALAASPASTADDQALIQPASKPVSWPHGVAAE
jgi:Bacterial PH domain